MMKCFGQLADGGAGAGTGAGAGAGEGEGEGEGDRLGMQHCTLLPPGQCPASKRPPAHEDWDLSKQLPCSFLHDFWTQHKMLPGSLGQSPLVVKPAMKVLMAGWGSC